MSVKDLNQPNRAQRRKQRTRQRLLEAAEHCLNRSGYTRLTIRQITETADLGYGTFYLHFDNLDDVVWAIMDQKAQIINDELIAQLAELPPRRRAYLSWVQIFRVVAVTPVLFLEMFGKGGSAQLIRAYQDWLARTHEANLNAGNYQPHDLSLPTDFQAQYMAGATLRVLCWWAENNFVHSPEDMANMLYEMTYHESPPGNL